MCLGETYFEGIQEVCASSTQQIMISENEYELITRELSWT